MDPLAATADPQLQSLKQAAVDLQAELRAQSEALRVPASSRVSLDLSVGAPDLQIQELKVIIDREAPIHQVYDHDGAMAFRSGGLQRIADFSAAAGTHRIHAEFSALLNSDAPQNPPLTGSFDQSFDKYPGQPLTIEIALRRDDDRSAPALRMSLLSAGHFAAGSAGDPRLREAQYFAADRHPLYAAALLQPLAAALPGAAAVKGRLADAWLDLGVPAAAEALYASLRAHPNEREFQQAQVRLAWLDYRAGAFDAAATRLARLPAAQSTDLRARIQLFQGRYADAMRTLQSIDAAQRTPIERYNLGIAQLRADRTDEGRATLDALGTAPVDSDTLRDLRDKANLVLGYDLLRHQENRAAVPVFERIRLEGPYTARALLGLGWARFAEHGRTPRGASVFWSPAADPATADTPVVLPPGSGERDADLRRALVPWIQLIDRDPLDPAVQEGLLAVPYALQKLGANAQAESYYRNAVAKLQSTRSELDQLIDQLPGDSLFHDLVASGPLDDSGWTWQLPALPVSRSSWALRRLIGEDRFQMTLRDYRDALNLDRELGHWQQALQSLQQSVGCRPPDAAVATGRVADRLSAPAPSVGPAFSAAPCDGSAATRLGVLAQRAAVLQPQAQAIATAALARLQSLALAELQGQRKITQTYLLQARMALARLYDAPPPEAGP